MRYRAIAFLLVSMALGMSAYGQSKSQIDAAFPRIPARPGSLDKLTIRFVNRGCGWFCPMYSIEINGDGSITYVGGKFARVKGTQRGHASLNKVQQLVNKFYSSRYFSLLPQYGTCGGDGKEFEFSIEWPGVSKHVMDCSNTLSYRISRGQELSPTEGAKSDSEYLTELKIFIEDAANVQPWGEMDLRNRIVPSKMNSLFKSLNDPANIKLNSEAFFSVDHF